MTIKYFNKQLNETAFRRNVKDLAAAWELAGDVCDEKNWNKRIFKHEVTVEKAR